MFYEPLFIYFRNRGTTGINANVISPQMVNFEGGDNSNVIDAIPGERGRTGQNAPIVPGIDGIDGNDNYPVPGERGPQGYQGQQGIPGLDGSDSDELFSIPGERGIQGIAGSTGANGTSGFTIPGMDGVDADDLYFMPGERGATGTTGSQGIPGTNAPLIPGLDGTDADEMFSIPGERGIQGIQGISGSNGTNAPIVPGMDGADADEIFAIPGERGIQGIQGNTGIAGTNAALVPGIDGADGDEMFQIPGERGIQGIQGITGAVGTNAPLIPGLDGSDGDEFFQVPGERGATGTAGSTGAQGIPGLSIPGLDGADADDSIRIPGERGAVGIQGIAGSVGPQGLDGIDGDDTYMMPGERGAAGTIGIDGRIGPPGTDGADGDDVYLMPGERGAIGIQGIQGIQGVPGVTVIGFDGADSDDAYRIPGERGAAGVQGPIGLGFPGLDGTDADDAFRIPGERGPIGNTGSQGIQGVKGLQGNPGMDGADSDDYYRIPGERGAIGLTGIQGPMGIPGLDGQEGSDSFFMPGERGTQGVVGPVGLTIPGYDGNDGGDFIIQVGLDRGKIAGPGQVVYTTDGLMLKSESTFAYDEASNTLTIGLGRVTLGDFIVTRAQAGGIVTSSVVNESNSASSAARDVISVAGSSAGDAYTLYDISGVVDWGQGVDNSDSDNYKIFKSANPGSNDYFIIDTSGNIRIPTGSVVISSGILDSGSNQWNISQLGGAFNLIQANANACGIELGLGVTGDRASYIDFHSDTTNTDFSTRLIRDGGVNANFDIINDGTGLIYFYTDGADPQFAIQHVAGAANYPYVRGSVAGAAELLTNANALAITPAGGVVYINGNGSAVALQIFDSANGAGAQIGLFGNGGTTPNKYIRAQSGTFDIVNNAYTKQMFLIEEDSGIKMLQAASSGLLTISGKANVNTTAVGNVGAGEDDLMSYSMPANSFNAAGRGVRITAWGTVANNAATKNLRFYWGSTNLFNVGLAVNQAFNWRIVAEVFSTGTDAQDWNYIVTAGSTGASVMANGTSAQDDASAIVVKCTGQATNNNDIVQEGLFVEFFA